MDDGSRSATMARWVPPPSGCRQPRRGVGGVWPFPWWRLSHRWAHQDSNCRRRCAVLEIRSRLLPDWRSGHCEITNPTASVGSLSVFPTHVSHGRGVGLTVLHVPKGLPSGRPPLGRGAFQMPLANLLIGRRSRRWRPPPGRGWRCTVHAYMWWWRICLRRLDTINDLHATIKRGRHQHDPPPKTPPRARPNLSRAGPPLIV